MRICVIIVTYDDRFHLLSRVIQSLLEQDINKIVIVDNNSTQNSKNKLIQFQKEYGEKIDVLFLSQNLGSAGGNSIGLKKFYSDYNSEFVWLLDDDNLPYKDALDVLKSFWKELDDENKEKRVALLSFRENRKIYEQALSTSNPDLVVGRRNGFLGIHIGWFFQKLFNKSNIDPERRELYNSKNTGLVSASYYGGLFFHKNLLDSIGFPKEEFFVYSDDIEFSSRITKLKGKIYLVLKSRIIDIEGSWQKRVYRKSILNLPLKNTNSIDRLMLYYTYRNKTYFEKNNWADKSFLYSINKIIYLFLLRLISFIYRSSFDVKVINLAIKDGLRGNLGKRKEDLFK